MSSLSRDNDSLSRILGALALTAAAALTVTACSSTASGAPAASTTATSAPSKGTPKPLPAGESRVAGTVASVSGTQLVVTKKDGSTETLTTDSTTKVEGGPLRQGQRVTTVVKGQQALNVRVAQPRGSGAAPTTTPSS